MLRVPIRQATPGMRLSLPVQHPRRHTMLLSEGYVLTASLIRKLSELNIHEVWVEFPNTDQIKQYVSPEVLHLQSQLVGLVADLFDIVHRDAHAELEFTEYRETLQNLIETLVSDPVAASYIVELGGTADNELRHACEVCFLSLLLGLKLQGYLVQQRKRLPAREARDVVTLGIGSMLHDVGMIALDESVRLRYDTTRNENDPEWREHVVLGHKMVSGSLPPAAAGIVLHHHQHFDGSGFPAESNRDGSSRGLKGQEIHVFARIVCAADHFDKVRRPASDDVVPRVRVLKELLSGELRSRFDPVVLSALTKVVPAYPPGSLVTLNTKKHAIVTDWHPDEPCRPTVQVSSATIDIDSSGREPAQYDLRKHPELTIIEHDGIDVREDNFSLAGLTITEQRTAA